MRADPETVRALFGTGDSELAAALLAQAARAAGAVGGEGTARDTARDFMLAAIRDFAPRDAPERMLAVQMAATHAAMMSAAERLADAA